MSMYLWFGYGKMGVMKLFTKRLQGFTFQRDVTVISFAIVGNQNKPKMKSVPFVLHNYECMVQRKITNDANAVYN